MAPRKASGKPVTGAKALKGSAEAKRVLAVVLEALSGLRGTSESAEALGISLSRYYQLETRALNGMLVALEPRPRGRQKTPEKAIELLEREKKALKREVARYQALLRAAQRTVGLRPRKKAAKRGPKRGSRGATVLKTLREPISRKEGGTDGTTDERPLTAGGDHGQ